MYYHTIILVYLAALIVVPPFCAVGAFNSGSQSSKRHSTTKYLVWSHAKYNGFIELEIAQTDEQIFDPIYIGVREIIESNMFYVVAKKFRQTKHTYKISFQLAQVELFLSRIHGSNILCKSNLAAGKFTCLGNHLVTLDNREVIFLESRGLLYGTTDMTEQAFSKGSLYISNLEVIDGHAIAIHDGTISQLSSGTKGKELGLYLKMSSNPKKSLLPSTRHKSTKSSFMNPISIALLLLVILSLLWSLSKYYLSDVLAFLDISST